MFGPRLNSIFRSRWSAVWWAMGMLVTAWSLTPSEDADTQPDAAPTHHKANPWAKDAG